MAFAQVRDTTLFYTDEGSGQPLLLVHGWTCDSHDWSWQIPAFLGAGYRVIAVDLRGHGRSQETEEGYTPREFAADLAALLRQLTATPAVVIGHSLGGAVAVAMAVADADIVRAIVPVDAAYGNGAETKALVDQLMPALLAPDGKEVAKGLFLQMFYPAASPLNLRTWHARRLEGLSHAVVAKTFQGLVDPGQFMFNPESEEVLRKVRCPALSFRAGRDDPQAMAAWEASVLAHPKSRAVGWEGSGHFLHQERPAEFNALVLDWLAGLDD
ncbi:MAG: alpha/beta hydrolase [Chloroflexi bacterium]|nr:alpha/beta hydrolase [Chloroflexota bacterium]